MITSEQKERIDPQTSTQNNKLEEPKQNGKTSGTPTRTFKVVVSTTSHETKLNISTAPRESAHHSLTQTSTPVTAISRDKTFMETGGESQVNKESGEEGGKERVSANRPRLCTPRGTTTTLPDLEQGCHNEGEKEPLEEDHRPNLVQPTNNDTNREEIQTNKGQGSKPTFCFGPGAAETLNKRGYRTTDLSANFWRALGVKPPVNSGVNRSVVIPLLIKKRWTAEVTPKHKFLACKTGRLNNAVLRLQVSTHDSGVWSTIKAKEILTNETALALNKMLKLGKDMQPPFTTWEDASWHFKWTTDTQSDTACCTWLAMVVLAPNEEVGLHKPGKQLWFNLSEDLEGLLGHRVQGDRSATKRFLLTRPITPKACTRKEQTRGIRGRIRIIVSGVERKLGEGQEPNHKKWDRSRGPTEGGGRSTPQNERIPQ